MKTSTFHSLLTSIAFFSICSCTDSKLGDSEAIKPTIQKLYASTIETDASETRATLGSRDEGKYAVKWQKGDRIQIYSGSNYSVGATAVADYGDSTGTSFTIVKNSLDSRPFLAFYPESMVKSMSSGTITIDFPQVQHYVENTVSPGSLPMVAYNNTVGNDVLSFKNICGLLKVYLYDKNETVIDYIMLAASENIYGTGNVSMSGSNPVFTVKGGNIIKLVCDEGVKLGKDESNATEFTFILPPTIQSTFGFTITAVGHQGDKEVYMYKKATASANNTIKRRIVGNMPKLAFDKRNIPNYIDENGIDQGPGIMIDGIIWAPVNCGYKAIDANGYGYPYGKLYQWGRSDGLGYGSWNDGSFVDENGETIRKGNVSSTPQKNIFHYYSYYGGGGSSTYCYWSDIVKNTYTWTYLAPGIDDPSPDGWMVPSTEYLENLALNHSESVAKDGIPGMYLFGIETCSTNGNKLFLPYSGTLDSGGGRNRNSIGGYWSADRAVVSMSYYNAYYLSLSNASINFNYVAIAQSVRCIRNLDERSAPGENEDYVDGDGYSW